MKFVHSTALSRILVAAILCLAVCPFARVYALHRGDSTSADTESVDDTLSKIQQLRRTLQALQDAGKAEKQAAEHEKAIGGSRLKQATSSARQAAELMRRAKTLLNSEAALKLEQVS